MLDPIIAGDGHAYFAYTYQNETTVSQTTREDCGVSTTITATDTVLHFMVMRVGADGSSSQTDVRDWESRSLDVETNQAHTYSNIGAIPSLYVQMITNADQGVVFGWEADTPDYCASGKENPRKSCYADVPAASTYGFGSNTTPSAVWPVLQAQDGTFYGGDNNGNLIKFNQSGGIFWSVPNDSPQIATADGGVIGSSGITYDINGNANGQIANMPTTAWFGDSYQISGSLQSVEPVPVNPATSMWASLEGNPSHNGASEKNVVRLGGPTKLGSNPPYRYNGTEFVPCVYWEEVPPGPVWGYQECYAYTILDHKGKVINRAGLILDEEITSIDQAKDLPKLFVTKAPPGTASTDDEGILKDDVALFLQSGPLPADAFALSGQTITLHKSGTIVRVNCIDQEATDSTVTDITNACNPEAPTVDCTCTRNTH